MVSIVIPVYNVEEYIRECIQSVINQTYTELECIIVDDCGDDSSMDICNDILSSYNGPIRFRILHHERNSGLSAARNTGIKAACGEYIFFMDSDDTITPNCIEVLVALALKHPKVDIVQGLTYLDHPAQLYMSYRGFPEYTSDTKWIHRKWFKRIPPMVWNRLIRTDFITRNDLYFCEGVLHEDEHWRYCAYPHITAIAFSCVPTYHYRQRSTSIMSVASPESLTLECIKVMKHLVHNNRMTYTYYPVRFMLEVMLDAYRHRDITDRTTVDAQSDALLRLIADNQNTPLGMRVLCQMMRLRLVRGRISIRFFAHCLLKNK